MKKEGNGILKKIRELNKKAEDVNKFRKEHSKDLFIKFMEKLNENGLKGIKEEDFNNFNKRFNSLKDGIEVNWKYNSLEFDEIKGPGHTKATEKNLNVITYFILKNESVINILLEETISHKTVGFGLSIIYKNEREKEFQIGLQAIYGTTEDSAGGKINDKSKEKGYQTSIPIAQDKDDDTFIEEIAKEFINILDKIEKDFQGNNSKGGNKMSEEKLKSILTAIQTKPFLILAGVSGTGKTQIARIVAGVMAKGVEKNDG